MAKKKGMNRTAGTARRKMSASERVSYGLKTGAPLTGSASGVKSISLREAGEALTQGIVTVRGGKLKFSPEGLAMALPVGKVAKAAKALRAAGKTAQAAALEARVLAKKAGRELGPQAVKNLGPGTIRPVGPTFRATSESVFSRLPNPNIPGAARTFDIYDDPLLEGAGRFKTIREIKAAAAKRGIKVTERGASKMDRLLGQLEKRQSLPAAGSVEMVKKTAKQFGQKVSGKEAKMISRLLRGRGK
jgi:hypothetical protein